MEDLLYKGRVERLNIAFSHCTTTDLVNEAVLRHNCDPPSAHLLGRALTASVLSASLLQGDERLNIRWQYRGHAKTILVDVGADGSTRGFISPTNLSDYSSDTDSLFGDKANLSVIRSKNGQVLNSGTTESILQDVVNDLSYYFAISEQVETSIMVLIGFNADTKNPVHLCQGIMLQALPDCDLELFDKIRNRMVEADNRELLARKTDSDNQFETIINQLVDGITARPDLHITKSGHPHFKCTCTHEKMGAVLNALPYDDRMDIVKKNEDLKIHCQFCNEEYVLTIKDCIAEWNKGKQ